MLSYTQPHFSSLYTNWHSGNNTKGFDLHKLTSQWPSTKKFARQITEEGDSVLVIKHPNFDNTNLKYSLAIGGKDLLEGNALDTFLTYSTKSKKDINAIQQSSGQLILIEPTNFQDYFESNKKYQNAYDALFKLIQPLVKGNRGPIRDNKQ